MNTVDNNFKRYTQKSVNKKPEIYNIQQKIGFILDQYKLPKINYLNIDVEGSEIEH